MKRQALPLFRLLLAAALISQVAGAQVTTATLHGDVADASGAAIPNATVKLTNDETGATLTATTDGQGAFTLTFLPVGRYRLAIRSPGFKEQTITGLELVAGQRLRQSYKLTAGGVFEGGLGHPPNPPRQNTAGAATATHFNLS